MPVLQLSVRTDARSCEALEAACFAAGAVAVTLLDAANSPILEPRPGETPLWPSIRLVAHFPAGTDPDVLLAALDVHGAVAELVPDREWEREWLKDLRPMRLGTRLWVCPLGQRVDARSAVVVSMDPGLAFGTGTHPTTAMCLQWLDGADLHGREVLDYGCGSGILAIAALKLGAHSAVAVDIDEQALVATAANALVNGVADRLQVLPASASPPLADIVLANILAEPLIELAPRFGSLTRKYGRLVVSGLLADQAPAVARASAPWFDMNPFAAREEWVCLEGSRR
jgi:ribosomal protein L11 methyltransferase